MILSRRVEELFIYCLYNKDELDNRGNPIVEPVFVEGITAKFGFHPTRLEECRLEVELMLDELDPQFKEGWSFLNMCVTSDYNQWGEHINCEQLLVMAIGLKRARYCFERSLWTALPGGVPYIQII